MSRIVMPASLVLIIYYVTDRECHQIAEFINGYYIKSVFQYDEHLTQLENKLLLAQERAMQDDDQTWMGGDDENYTIAEPDRTVSIYMHFHSDQYHSPSQ